MTLPDITSHVKDALTCLSGVHVFNKLSKALCSLDYLKGYGAIVDEHSTLAERICKSLLFFFCTYNLLTNTN